MFFQFYEQGENAIPRILKNRDDLLKFTSFILQRKKLESEKSVDKGHRAGYWQGRDWGP